MWHTIWSMKSIHVRLKVPIYCIEIMGLDVNISEVVELLETWAQILWLVLG